MKTKYEEILENIKKNDPRFKDMVIKPIGRIRTMRNLLVNLDILDKMKHKDEVIEYCKFYHPNIKISDVKADHFGYIVGIAFDNNVTYYRVLSFEFQKWLNIQNRINKLKKIKSKLQ